MADTSDIRKGFTFKMEGKVFTVVDFQHVKPGKGGAFVRTKVKNVENGRVIEITFNSGASLEEVRLDRSPYQYLYKDGDEYVFMNSETYEQVHVSSAAMQGKELYLKENMDVFLYSVEEKIIDIDVPFFVEFEVTHAEPGVRGNTVSGANKPVECETGLKVMVPLFINQGDKIKIDTRTGEYVERV